jgi:hypothetical protein
MIYLSLYLYLSGILTAYLFREEHHGNKVELIVTSILWPLFIPLGVIGLLTRLF